MKRVSILVTHLLGSGHLSRALTLAHASREAGLSVQVVSGGMPASHLRPSGVAFVQLPPVQSQGANFTCLLDDRGMAVSQALLDRRAELIVAALREFSPHCVITELFPFGRRVLRGEFEAALMAIAGMRPKPLVFASIRDILSPPSNRRKADVTESLLMRHYDGVLVHSDPDVLPLEASWPVTPGISAMLSYTGFIAAPDLPQGLGSEGSGEILVTAGGGAVGRRLFETAIEAARLGRRRWRLLVGGVDQALVSARLNQAARGAPVLAEPARQDYRALLQRCAGAVGHCGYNTAVDWLQAGVPGVFVPFAEAGETEQTTRAAWLASRFGYGVIPETELFSGTLAGAVEAAIRRGRFEAQGVRLDGALQASRLISSLLERRA